MQHLPARIFFTARTRENGARAPSCGRGWVTPAAEGVGFPRGTPHCDLQSRSDSRSEREAGRANPAETREPRPGPVSPSSARGSSRGLAWAQVAQSGPPLRPPRPLSAWESPGNLTAAGCLPPSSASSRRGWSPGLPRARSLQGGPDRERPLGSCPPAERTARVLGAVCSSGFHVPTLHLLLDASDWRLPPHTSARELLWRSVTTSMLREYKFNSAAGGGLPQEKVKLKGVLQNTNWEIY